MVLENLGWALIGCSIGMYVAATVFDFSFSEPPINVPETPQDPIKDGGNEKREEVEAIDFSRSKKSSDEIIDLVKKYRGDRTNYTEKFVDEPPLDEDEPGYSDDVDEEESEGAEEEQPKSLAFKDGGAPHVITTEELELPWLGETTSLLYFTEDNTLMEEVSEELIDDVERTIGDGLEHFGESDPDQPDYVIVRNEAFDTQYEIYRIRDSYVSRIMGVPL